jgi:hypothetical protein
MDTMYAETRQAAHPALARWLVGDRSSNNPWC